MQVPPILIMSIVSVIIGATCVVEECGQIVEKETYPSPQKELTKYLKYNYYLDLNVNNLVNISILFTCVGRIDVDSNNLGLVNLIVRKNEWKHKV